MRFQKIEFKDRMAISRGPETIVFGKYDPVPQLGSWVSLGLIRGKVTDVSYDYDESTIYITLN